MLAIQSFDYQIEHIDGTKNIVADNLSRFCPKLITEETPKEVISVLDELSENGERLFEAFRASHNAIVGHGGVQRTINLIQRNLVAMERLTHENKKLESLMTKREIEELVRDFVRQCPCCQKMSNLKVSIQSHPFTTSSYSPMSRVNVDYIESLVPDEDGNDMIVVVIDSFSRFVFLQAVKSTKAQEAAKALLRFTCTFGIPDVIRSDRGTQFTSHLIEDFMALSGIRHELTMTNSKEENALVERANKEVMRHLRNILFDRNVYPNWGDYLPLVQRIMNSCIHRSIGVAPCQIVFGNAIDLNRGFLFPTKNVESPLEKEQIIGTWIDRMRSAQAKIIEIARDNLQRRDEIHMNTKKDSYGKFPDGSFVLLEYNNPFRKGPNSKLKPYLKGPVRVINSFGDKYTIQDLVTMKLDTVHLSRLKEFEGPLTEEEATELAIRDTDQFLIEKVLRHFGNPKGNKSQLFFEVKWLGFEKTTKEPWFNLKRNVKLHEYLRSHKNKDVNKLLPQEYRLEENEK
jgi:hypothetical protein